MITEDYVSYEIAKLLKEKGFDESIFEFYVENENTIRYARNKDGFRLSELGSIYYPHITHQMTMKWLREVYKIYIDIETCYTYINKNENFEVTGYEFTIHSQYEPCYEDHETYNSYEKAVEAALKYILENLI